MDNPYFLNCKFTGSWPEGKSWLSWLEKNMPIGVYSGLFFCVENEHVTLTEWKEFNNG
jgi:hypothetical protein